MRPLGEHLAQEMDREALTRGFEAVERRLTRRRRVCRAAVAGAGLAVAAAALAWLWPAAPVRTLTLADGRPVSTATAGEWPLADGSRVRLSDRARLEVERVRGAEVTLALRRGTARFEVQSGGGRRWTIRAGGLTVRVLGTAFTVSRDDGRASVAVHRGVVSVETGVEARRLYAGERFELGPPPDEAVALARSSEPEVADTTAGTGNGTAPSPRTEPGTGPGRGPGPGNGNGPGTGTGTGPGRGPGPGPGNGREPGIGIGTGTGTGTGNGNGNGTG
ncbi:MAG TPA: FecR family protein, partial [Sandaracinaceae bacterium LLY-WYZ-13_1]|nr:FecR family protein [Sandaracinaceae bacterium LLY-WYZ-13_1]